VELLVHPGLYRMVGTVAGLLMVVYLVLVVAALAHSAATTPRGRRWQSGLGWVFLGVALMVIGIVVPMVGVAGAQWAELLVLGLPFALVLGVRQQALSVR